MLEAKLRSECQVLKDIGELPPEFERYAGQPDTVPIGVNPHRTLHAMNGQSASSTTCAFDSALKSCTINRVAISDIGQPCLHLRPRAAARRAVALRIFWRGRIAVPGHFANAGQGNVKEAPGQRDFETWRHHRPTRGQTHHDPVAPPKSSCERVGRTSGKRTPAALSGTNAAFLSRKLAVRPRQRALAAFQAAQSTPVSASKFNARLVQASQP